MRPSQLAALTLGVLFVSAIFAQSRPAVEQQPAAGGYVVVIKSVTSQTGRKEGPTNTKAEGCYELLVQKPDAKGQKMHITFSRLVSQTKGSGLEGFDYDTDKPAGQDSTSLQSQFKAAIGMPIIVTVEPDGKIGKISGLDEIAKEAGAADDRAEAHRDVTIYRALVTSSLDTLLFHYPERPLVKGYAWTRNDPESMGPMGALKMTQNYKVRAVTDTPEGPVADIDLVANNDFDKPVATDADSAKFAKIAPIDKATSQVAGTIKVNLRTRMLVSMTLRTKKTIKGTSMLDGGKLPFNFITQGDTEIVVTPVKNTPASSTRPVQTR